MPMEGNKPCECGSTQYGYYADSAIVYICYKCGKFDVEGFSKKVEDFFAEEPKLILQIIQDGFLHPLDTTPEYDV